jgi:hypothetical protein
VTIQLRGHELRAHRAILAKTSAWFADEFANDPKVSVKLDSDPFGRSLTLEQYDSKLLINLPAEDAAAMKAMVRFCYTGDYSCPL